VADTTLSAAEKVAQDVEHRLARELPNLDDMTVRMTTVAAIPASN
jgi:hypothetical protein